MTTSPTAERTNEWLPEHCPTWCEGQHAESYAECGDWEGAQLHTRGGGGGVLSQITYAGRHCRDYGAGWDLTATQRPLGPTLGYWGPELIELEVYDEGFQNKVRLSLTTGEARVIARQLVAMADLLDL